MTTQATPTHDSKQKRFKGSLAGTFTRTLLIITLIPLALMGAAAYFNARTLLQNQAVTQLQGLLTSQTKVIDREISDREAHLGHLLESSDFTILIELALHANSQSSEFNDIRTNLLKEFKNQEAQGDTPALDQLILVDTGGNIKISTNPKWEGLKINLAALKETADHHSIILNGLAPLYENEIILATIQDYQTKRGSTLGSIVGITEKKSLQKIVQPLNNLSPMASAYFVLSDQQFIYSNPDTGELKPAETTSQDKINSAFSKLISEGTPRSETLDITTPSGDAAIAQLQWSPKLQAGIVLAVKSDTIYSQTTNFLRFTGFLILGVLLATALVIVISINRVVNPLHKLSEATHSFVNGDLSRRAEVKSNDEVGVLAGSFNQLAEELDRTQHLVEQHAENGKYQTLNDETAQSMIASGQVVTTAQDGEISQNGFEEYARLYEASKLIAKANASQEILEIVSQILKEAPYPILVLQNQNKKLAVFSSNDQTKENITLPKFSEANTEKVGSYLTGPEVIAVTNAGSAPSALNHIMQEMEFDTAACLPVRENGELRAVLIIGGRNQILSKSAVQPYINLADLMSVAMEKAEVIQQTNKRLHDAEALAAITEAISASSDQQGMFTALHDKLQQVMGSYDMTVVLYDEKSNTINVPFHYEDQKVSAINPSLLEEGLISVLLRMRQPLLIAEDVEHKTIELGAKATDKAVRSWMGVPMLAQNNLIGALVIQDKQNEHAFNEDSLKFFNAVGGQVAGVINNTRLLEESKHRTIQLETAAEIARDISSSLDLDELLVKAVEFIRERFDFYHASVFLHDLQGEFTVVREATGEIGLQMKRSGYKIAIGSKSIVGFVSSRGEQLVVDNTTKDVTYDANPLFPDTRSEAAFPLKVGERILGEINVQSNHPYAFTEDKIRSLQILADQMAIAVVNTELFSETQEHLSQHRLLHHITTTAASGTTLEEALESAVNGLQVTLGGDRVAILLTNREKNSLEVKASTGYAEDITKVEVPIGNGITGWSAAHKRPLRVGNVTEDPRYIAVSSNTRSELAIPLVYRNEILGVLNVESESADAYTENDEEMLGTLGGSLAAIIANARLVEQIRVQAERDRLIYEVTSKIRRSTDIQSIMSATANELTRLTGARYAKIQIKPENNNGKQESVK